MTVIATLYAKNVYLKNDEVLKGTASVSKNKCQK